MGPLLHPARELPQVQLPRPRSGKGYGRFIGITTVEVWNIRRKRAEPMCERRMCLQITRGLGGLTIAVHLTDEELFAAYQEQQNLFDIENVHQELESQPDCELINLYGFPLSVLGPLEDEMATKLRSNLSKEMSWDYALSDAIRSVVGRHKPFLYPPPESQEI